MRSNQSGLQLVPIASRATESSLPNKTVALSFATRYVEHASLGSRQRGYLDADSQPCIIFSCLFASVSLGNKSNYHRTNRSPLRISHNEYPRFGPSSPLEADTALITNPFFIANTSWICFSCYGLSIIRSGLQSVRHILD